LSAAAGRPERAGRAASGDERIRRNALEARPQLLRDDFNVWLCKQRVVVARHDVDFQPLGSHAAPTQPAVEASPFGRLAGEEENDAARVSMRHVVTHGLAVRLENMPHRPSKGGFAAGVELSDQSSDALSYFGSERPEEIVELVLGPAQQQIAEESVDFPGRGIRGVPGAICVEQGQYGDGLTLRSKLLRHFERHDAARRASAEKIGPLALPLANLLDV